MAQRLFIEDTLIGPIAALMDGARVVEIVLPFGPNPLALGSIHSGRVRKSIAGTRDCLVDLANGQTVHLSARRGAADKNVQDGAQIRVQIVREAQEDKRPEASTKLKAQGRYSMLVSRFRGLQGADGKASTRPVLVPTGWGMRLKAAAQDVADGAVSAEAAQLAQGPLSPLDAMVARLPARYSGQIIISSRRLWAEHASVWAARYPDLAESLVLETEKGSERLDRAGVSTWLAQVKAGAVPLVGRTRADLRFGTVHGITVLDVNAGQALKHGDARMVNLAAAETLAALLPTAHIGGLCLVDFIDMDGKQDRHAVHEALDAAFSEDRHFSARTDLSQFGCLELRRRSTGPSLQHRLRDEPLLEGLALLRDIQAAAPPTAHGKLLIHVPAVTAAWLKERAVLTPLAASLHRPIALEVDETLAPGTHHIALQSIGR